jgi:transposase
VAEGLITLSVRELDRAEVVREVAGKRLAQKEAAARLGLSVRQLKRLVRRFREAGVEALVSKRRGRPSNNRLAQTVRVQALEFVRSRYADFGPTLAHEKLTEVHGLRLSVESVRQLMIGAGLWQPKRRRQAKAFQLRERRPRLGELVQIDGSPHNWFEGRAPACTLLVFIDDATGQLLALRFAPAETTGAYMELLHEYLDRYGRPVSLYSDRHSIFRVNAKEDDLAGQTQFARALQTLQIEAIHAHTPQAKGRVERANLTLQDRLVKEMRLAGIASMQAGNAFLEQFRLDYNRRFAIEPKRPENAHRPVLHSAEELALIFSLHSTRRLSKNLTLQFQNTLYQIRGRGRGLAQANVTVCEHFDGTVTLLYQSKPLAYTTYQRSERPSAVEDEKTLNQRVEQALAAQLAKPLCKPKPDHPWRRSPIGKGTLLLGNKGDISTLS